MLTAIIALGLLGMYSAYRRGVVLGNRNGLARGYGKGFVAGRTAGREEVLDDVNRRLNAIVKNNPPKFVQ